MRIGDAWLPPELARERAARIRHLHYRFALRIDAHARTLRACQCIEFVLDGHAARDPLVLDWRPESGMPARSAALASLEVNDAQPHRGSFRFGSGHLVIAAGLLRPGANRIALDWQAPICEAGAPLTRYRDATDGNVYVYTLLVPADASRLFPCFDQPDLKARFTLALAVPPSWHVIANAPCAALRSLAGERVFEFAPTEPISTYLFAFAAGPFVPVHDGPDAGCLWVRRSQRKAARRNAPETLALNAQALRYFARYFGHRFPFAKYDLVAIPQFPYRGMEHAGATFLAEKDVLLPPDAGTVARFHRAQLVFHETAHQWAGNLVTMRAFDDLWLKEGFANFMAYKLPERLLPRAHAQVAFHRLKLQAVATDSSPGATALHWPLRDAAAAKSAYGAIVYAKAPALLRQLEFDLGPAVFRRGVRSWMARHAYAASDWRDLVAALAEAAGRSLAGWARAWILRPGLPRLGVQTRPLAGGRTLVRIGQSSATDASNAAWPLAFEVAITTADRRRSLLRIRLDRSTVDLQVRGAVEEVALDVGDHAYAIVAAELPDVATARRQLARSRSPLRRIQRWEGWWQSVRDNRLHPASFVRLAIDALSAERDEMIVAAVLERLHTAMDRMLEGSSRAALARDLDALVLAQVRAAEPSLRGAWTAGLVALASTDAGLKALESLVLRGRRAVNVTPLQQRAVEMLVVRGAYDRSDAPRALGPAAKRDPAFGLRLAAAIPDRHAKRKVFERVLADDSLSDDAVLATAQVLNHPAHAALTLPLLAPALRALPVLERRRKIFFVNRWVDAFVGGQSSEHAQRVLREAMARTSRDEAYGRKLLEAEHDLALVVAIRRRRSDAAAQADATEEPASRPPRRISAARESSRSRRTGSRPAG